MLYATGLYDAVGLPDRPTTSTHGPFHRVRPIDWIYSSGTVASEGRVHDDIRASDHYPISAKLSR